MARPKGSTNAKSIELKTMILNALNKAGGAEYLYEQSQSNPTAFLTLIGKTLPLALKPEGEGKFSITWEN